MAFGYSQGAGGGVKTTWFIKGVSTRVRILAPFLMLLPNDTLFAVEPNVASGNQTENAVHAQSSEKEARKPERLSPLGLEKLMDIPVTTVTRTKSTLGQSPAAVSVITQNDIRRSGATTIAELFRRVPGMNVARIDNNKWAISARGFTDRFNGKMLVQMDGRTLYNPFTSGVYWDTTDYPLEDIERIEVIRGPRAGTWGANAVNGIINIITKSAAETQGGFVSAGGGDQQPGFASARVGGRAGAGAGASSRIYAKGFTRDNQAAAGGDAYDEWSGRSGGFRVDWNQTPRNLITFQGDILHSDADRHDFRAQPTPPFFFENFETESARSANLLSRMTQKLSEDSSWTVQAYWDSYHRDLENLRIPFRWDTYDVDVQHQFSMGERQRFLWGGGYRRVDAFLGNSGRDNGFVFNLTENDHRVETFSLYGQYEYAISPDTLKLLLNARFENNDFTGFEVQPSAQLLYTPTASQALWASVARAVRTPNINDFYANPRLLPSPTIPPVFPRQAANTHLEPETVRAYQIGHRVQATRNISVDSALFYNFYDDLVTQLRGTSQPGDGGLDLPVHPINGLKGRTYGAEISSTWRMTDAWSVYIAYSFLEMRLKRKDPALSPASEAAEEQSPQNQLYLQTSIDLQNNVELDLIGRRVGRVTNFNTAGVAGVTNTIPAYSAFDVRVAWRSQKNIELAIVGQNLFDNHHPEFGTSPLVLSPLVETRRSAYVKATWHF